jgi:hypothetical protein
VVGYGNANTQLPGPFGDGTDRIVSIRIFGMKMQINYRILLYQFIEIGALKPDFVGTVSIHSCWLTKKIIINKSEK